VKFAQLFFEKLSLQCSDSVGWVTWWLVKIFCFKITRDIVIVVNVSVQRKVPYAHRYKEFNNYYHYIHLLSSCQTATEHPVN